MAIDITEPIAQWLPDYDAKQLRRERRACQSRIDVARSADKKIHDNVNFITPGPHRFDNSESMFVRSALASGIYEDTKVAKWIDARLKQLGARPYAVARKTGPQKAVLKAADITEKKQQ